MISLIYKVRVVGPPKYFYFVTYLTSLFYCLFYRLKVTGDY